MAPLAEYLPNLLIIKRSPISLSTPNEISNLNLRAIAKPPQNPNYKPGSGTIEPQHVNNRGFFALFALIGVAFVVGIIWFFFWAKNGGFRWRKGDWEEYKSTVLRRKGPHGTTLSGATKTTFLGGGSVVAEANLDREEKGWKRGVQTKKHGAGKGKPKGNKNNDDEDVRAYRHEKSAKVGGLNRESDGVFNQDFAYSDSGNTYSDDISQQGSSAYVPINTPRAKKWTKPTKKAQQQQEPSTPSPQKNKKHAFYNQTPQSNASSDSHRPLRPNAQSPAGTGSPTRSRQSSPTKRHGRNSVPGSFYTDPLEFESRYSATNSDAGMTEDSRGTKTYFHPIPGLGTEGRNNGRGLGGFRRGGGRRDSLSDSEGETETVRS